MKQTLSSKCKGNVQPFLRDGILPPTEYNKTLKSLHTKAVKAVIRRQEDNSVLDDFPLEVSPAEDKLPRPHRVVLAQLRSNYCQRLRSYEHTKLNRVPDAVCPECRYQRHTTSHLFNCDATPTDLDVSALWLRPRAAIEFLLTLPSFNSLPPVVRPPPEPPP